MATTVATWLLPHRIRRLAAWVVASLGVLAVVGYLAVCTIAATMVTTPRRLAVPAPPAGAVSFAPVQFPARGGDVQIAAWYLTRAGATQAIVLAHGKDSNRATEFQGRFPAFAVALHNAGFVILMIDTRGHGASGDANFSFGLDERRDLLGGVDYLVAQGFAPAKIGLLGVSMGAAAAIGAMHDEPALGALVADCSYAEIEPLLQMHWATASKLPDVFLPGTLAMGRFVLGKDLTTADPVFEIDDLAARPVLIIHGAADAFTPPDQGRALAAANPQASYWEVPGARHAGSYTAMPDEYVRRVVAFFGASLR